MLKIFNKKIFKINLSWLIFDKFFRASTNLILSIILARSLGIPAVVGLHNARRFFKNEDLVIMDGSTGMLLIEPSRSVRS